jgi:hypothetical protein
MTKETVADESPRCSAKDFKLTPGAWEFRAGRGDTVDFGRCMGCLVA